MLKEDVLAALGALAHPRRLDAFKLLIETAPSGLLAGEIAERLDSKQNTMSTNLAVLLRAKLVKARREGRGVRYTADLQTYGSMMTYLSQNCCGGRMELCPETLASIERIAAGTPTEPTEPAKSV